MIVGLLGIAVLAGVGFDEITRRLSQRRRAWCAAIVGALLVVEYAALLGVQPSRLEIPAIDRWLNTLPKPFVIAEAPVYRLDQPGPFERQETRFMLHSTAHFQKTVHGYSGWRTLFHLQLYSKMENFPDDASLDGLSDIGVTYVVVHSDLYPPADWVQVEDRIRQFSSRLRLEHVEGAGRVYALVKHAGDEGVRGPDPTR